jgi:nitrogen fixation protein NifX
MGRTDGKLQEEFMKVAFCTNSLKEVDEHFGRATSVAVYDVNTDGAEFSELRSFIPIDAEENHKVDINTKVSALNDCSILYLTEIGGPAAAVVVRNKIHPIKVDENAPIDELLKNLVNKLNDSPPPWLRKAIQVK